MRHIEFRAKSAAFDNWVDGCYFKKKQPCGRVDHVIHDGRSEIIIDPKTLGQYTGLKDKNGVKIYEGDVLSYYLGSDYHIGEVKYDIDRFAIYWFRGSNILNRSCKNIYKRSKVTGNIHENKDLLS